MRFVHVLTLAVTLVALTVASATAHASGPNCSSGRNKRGYEAGLLIGKNLVQQAYLGAGSPTDDLDDFMDTVRDIVHDAIRNLPDDASDYVKCRAKGLAQGVCDALDDIQDCVVDTCLLDGQLWGALSAELYCVLSEEFGGLVALGLLPNPPDGLCGDHFEDGCQDEFADSATCDASCKPFTMGSFLAVFQESQANMCIYELPPDEP